MKMEGSRCLACLGGREGRDGMKRRRGCREEKENEETPGAEER